MLYQIFIQRIKYLLALALRVHEAGKAQNAQMLRGNRLFDAQKLMDFAHARLLAMLQKTQYIEPQIVRKRPHQFGCMLQLMFIHER